MTFLITYWKEFALVIVIAALLWFGGHYVALEDKAAQVTSLEAQLAQSKKAAPAVMDFNQKFNKEVKNAKKTDCINQPHSVAIGNLLY